MAEPENRRGEVSGTDVPGASADGTSASAQDPASSVGEGTGEAREQAEQPDWPVRDPEGTTERAGREWPGGEPDREAERTRRISRVEPEQETGRGPREGDGQATERTVRAPGSGVVPAPPETGPEAGPPTSRTTPVPPPGSAEQPTRQFRRPDFTGPPSGGWQPEPASDPAGPTDPRIRLEAGFPPPAGNGPSVPRGDSRQAPAYDERYETDPYGSAPHAAGPHTAGQAVPPAPEPPSASPAPPLYRRRGFLVTVALVAVAVLGAGLVFGGPALFGDAAAPRAEPPPPVQLRPAIKPLGGSGPVPDKQEVASALAPAVSNPALGTLAGVVLDARTGRTLWKQDARRSLVPASTAKLLTTGAALLALDHRQRFSTRVVRGSEPGSVVLVGGGDPTLSSLPKGTESVYPGAPHLGELVAEVKEATGGNVTSVAVDTSRYAGPDLAPGWLPADVPGGYVAPVEPVMLDGGRTDPTEDVSPRSRTPALDAGRALAERLGVPVSDVSTARAPEGAPVLGEVESATVQRMVRTTLQHSDNVLAETLAREVAIATGHEPSFAGAARAVREVLIGHGFTLAGTRMVDGSGLSPEDRVTPRALGSVLSAASAHRNPDGSLPPRTAKLRALLPALPVAGSNGSLADRYEGAASEGQGWVRAKTGTLSNVNSLAGTVVTRDGRLLVFAMLSNGTSSSAARPALDKVAAALRTCGCG